MQYFEILQYQSIAIPKYCNTLQYYCNTILLVPTSFQTLSFSSISSPSSPPTNNFRTEDFFGETVTFPPSNNESIIPSEQSMNILSSMNAFAISTVTKGMSSEVVTSANNDDGGGGYVGGKGGGDGDGPSVMAAHSVAVVWSDLLYRITHESSMSSSIIEVPVMAKVYAVSGLYATAGSSYVQNLDDVYISNITNTNSKRIYRKNDISLVQIAKEAIAILEPFDNDCSNNRNYTNHNIESVYDHSYLSRREVIHIHALQYMMDDRRGDALCILTELLETCPGDIFALNLIVDLSCALGDRKLLFR